jgi:hypothetical protein
MTGHEPDSTDRAARDGREPGSDLAVLLSERLGRRVRDLRIEVNRCGLVLRGRASSYHVKQLAQHTASAVANLPVLANEIVVTQG